MTDSLLIAVHAFVSHVSMSFSVPISDYHNRVQIICIRQEYLI